MPKEDIIDWPDLAPSDYHLFCPMKNGLRDQHYASDEERKTAVKWLKEQSIEFYMVGTHVLIQRCNIGIKRNSDCVEKKGCDSHRTSFILM